MTLSSRNGRDLNTVGGKFIASHTWVIDAFGLAKRSGANHGLALNTGSDRWVRIDLGKLCEERERFNEKS